MYGKPIIKQSTQGVEYMQQHRKLRCNAMEILIFYKMHYKQTLIQVMIHTAVLFVHMK